MIKLKYNYSLLNYNIIPKDTDIIHEIWHSVILVNKVFNPRMRRNSVNVLFMGFKVGKALKS